MTTIYLDACEEDILRLFTRTVFIINSMARLGSRQAAQIHPFSLPEPLFLVQTQGSAHGQPSGPAGRRPSSQRHGDPLIGKIRKLGLQGLHRDASGPKSVSEEKNHTFPWGVRIESVHVGNPLGQ